MIWVDMQLGTVSPRNSLGPATRRFIDRVALPLLIVVCVVTTVSWIGAVLWMLSALTTSLL